jgi:4-alpha-glucanotransferase
LKQYCNNKGIRIIGDIPFYVGYESAELWSRPEIFKLTKRRRPKYVGGVPPDLYSRTGQYWGNPVYDWQNLRNRRYDWWIRRIRHNLGLFDMVRIDHFRGFAAYWQIPAGSRTAKNGKWAKGPGKDFFDTLFKHFSASRVIAEDLGYITPDVIELKDRYKLAGMRVILFAFDSSSGGNVHSVVNHKKNCVVYTGTHDNNTIRGWFEQEAETGQKERIFDYTGRKVSSDTVHWELIRMAMSSVGKLVIIPMQDVLGLGSEARMNRPARTRGNWRWRLDKRQISNTTAKKLAGLAEIYGRS